MKLFRTRYPRVNVSMILVLFVFVFSFMSQSVSAIDESFYANNDVLFYNPDAKECITGPTATISNSVNQITKTAALESIFTQLISHKTNSINAVQAAAIMGNMFTESQGFNSDAHEIGNDIGYGLAQWSFGRRSNLEAFAAQKNVPISDVTMQVEFLLYEYDTIYKKLFVGSNFEKSDDVGKSTESWMIIFEAPGMKPINDPAKLNSERIPAAIKIYDFYKNIAPSFGAINQTNCANGNGAVAGDIVKTAIGYALQKPATTGMTDKSDARDTYQSAKEQYNPSVAWSDCGGYVATVMIASGVDPNYVKVSVSAQINYVKSKPNKYLVIENPNAGDLQPGDILLSNQVGHTTIYTGESAYPSVDASLDQRVPSVRTSGSSAWMLSHQSIIARVIK